jgi:hypothetical protein
VGGICGIGEEKLALNTNMIWTTVLSRERVDGILPSRWRL